MDKSSHIRIRIITIYIYIHTSTAKSYFSCITSQLAIRVLMVCVSITWMANWLSVITLITKCILGFVGCAFSVYIIILVRTDLIFRKHKIDFYGNDVLIDFVRSYNI